MSEKDLIEATNNTIDSFDIVKENIELDTINKIREYLNECNSLNISNSLEEIKSIIKENDKALIEQTTYFNNLSELIEKYKNYYIKSYKVVKESVFNIFEDDKINFFRDAFITIGGNSSCGKTSIITQIIRDLIIENKNAICLFYSLDDGIFMSIRRFIQHFIQYCNPNDQKSDYYTNNDIDYSSIENYKNVLERITVLENYNDIETDIEIIKSKTNIENPLIIIALDYLQIIPNKEQKDYRIFFNEELKKLKEIQQKEAKENGCIFFLLSQLNRLGTKSIAGLNDYRETSEIENLSDIALNINYVEQNNYLNTNRSISIVKNKIGNKQNYNANIENGIIKSLTKDINNIENNSIIEYKKTKINKKESAVDEYGKSTDENTLKEINRMVNELGYIIDIEEIDN